MIWLTLFMNRAELPGMSVTRTINADDEWLAEGFLETDYSRLQDADFEKTVHAYVSFLFANYLVASVCENTAHPDKPPLDPSTWHTVQLDDLFVISGSVTTALRDLEEYGHGAYPYVTTQATNNGIAGFYDWHTEEGGVLTVDSAVLGYCAYQKLPFSASDHVEKLTPRFSMNAYTALFLVTVINREQYRFNYGRKASQSRLRELSIKLPADSRGAPDWEYMERYIKSLPYASVAA